LLAVTELARSDFDHRPLSRALHKKSTLQNRERDKESRLAISLDWFGNTEFLLEVAS
jgi:hypothetical protein